jgi:pimeloyl-ACP methyl ester carboxylesterase
MKTSLAARLGAALITTVPLVHSGSAFSQTPTPKAKPPTASAGVSALPVTTVPKGSVPAQVQDVRILDGSPTDPYELERLGLGAVKANELGHARNFFERSWKEGQLPTAAYNLACVDAREKKLDAAFKQLERAIGAGFDEEETLKEDPDLAPLRGKPQWANILAGARKNEAAGDAAVVKEGVFVAPPAEPIGVLVLLHDAASDPLTASSPFVQAAHARRLFVAAPRGPSRTAQKRFGWGADARTFAAVDAAVAAARKKAGKPNLPVLLAGIGFGGTKACRAAVQKPGAYAGLASLGGAFDPGDMPIAQAANALRGIPLFFGVPRDAPQNLREAFSRGADALRQAGLAPAVAEWPSAGASQNFPAAVKAALDGLMGAK